MKRKGMRLMVIKDGDDGRSSKGKEKEMKTGEGEEETPEKSKKGTKKNEALPPLLEFYNNNSKNSYFSPPHTQHIYKYLNLNKYIYTYIYTLT